MMFKFCKSIEDFCRLNFLSLEGNHLPYFCIGGLLSQDALPRSINLADTRMDDLTAYHLVSGLIKRKNSEVTEISLARNPLLGFAFFSKVADLLSALEYPVNIKRIDLKDCTVSH